MASDSPFQGLPKTLLNLCGRIRSALKEEILLRILQTYPQTSHQGLEYLSEDTSPKIDRLVPAIKAIMGDPHKLEILEASESDLIKSTLRVAEGLLNQPLRKVRFARENLQEVSKKGVTSRKAETLAFLYVLDFHQTARTNLDRVFLLLDIILSNKSVGDQLKEMWEDLDSKEPNNIDPKATYTDSDRCKHLGLPGDIKICPEWRILCTRVFRIRRDIRTSQILAKIPRQESSETVLNLSLMVAPGIKMESSSNIGTPISGCDAEEFPLSTSSSSLTEFLKETFPELGQSVECPGCCRKVQPSSLQTWREHVVKDLNLYTCPYFGCGISLIEMDSRRELESHISSEHESDEDLPLTCIFCNMKHVRDNNEDDGDFRKRLLDHVCEHMENIGVAMLNAEKEAESSG